MGLLVYAGLLSLTAVVPSLAWAIPVLLAVGVANMLFYVPIAAILQFVAVPDMRGRAVAAKRPLSRVLSVVGFVAAGAVVERIGLAPTIVVASILVAAAALVGMSRPRLRAV